MPASAPLFPALLPSVSARVNPIGALPQEPSRVSSYFKRTGESFASRKRFNRVVFVLLRFSARFWLGLCRRRLGRCACIASGLLRPLSLQVFGAVSAGLVAFGFLGSRGLRSLVIPRAVPCSAPMGGFPLRTAGAAFLVVSAGMFFGCVLRLGAAGSGSLIVK